MDPAEDEAGAVVERALALRRLSGLEALDPELLTTLASRAELRRHRAGEALAAGRDPRPALHLVLEGRVRALGAEGESSVGAGGLVGDRPSPGGDVRASEDSLTLALPVEDLTELCEEHFGLLLVVMRAVARAALAKRRAGPEPADPADPAAPADELDLGGRIAFLSDCPTFAGVRVHTLGQLAQDAKPLLLRSGERLWSAGDTPGAIVVVTRGALRCRGEAGEFGIGPRALAGLVEAVAAAPHGYDAEADGEVHGLRLEVSALFDAMEDDPELAADVLAALARSSALALGL